MARSSAAVKHVITGRVAAELISHEGLVRESYRDPIGVWTWGIGVTAASGHDICPRYVDQPQSLRNCLEVFADLLRTQYQPAVDGVFEGRLVEHQFAAALSFHYNTGAIERATWVEDWLSGDHAAARLSIMNWCKPDAVIGRRTAERDLFFDGVWSNSGEVKEFAVLKPSYVPDYANPKVVEIASVLQEIFG